MLVYFTEGPHGGCVMEYGIVDSSVLPHVLCKVRIAWDNSVWYISLPTLLKPQELSFPIWLEMHISLRINVTYCQLLFEHRHEPDDI